MPQVPFTGVPSVAPSFEPTPRYQADVRPESFGVNVANAIQGMGNTLQSAGNEMFARGMAMQDLYNHSQAQEADTVFMKKAGEINDRLQSMEGKNAVEYYQKGFYEDLTKARKEVRDGLPNDMARKLFDSQTLRTVGQSLFSGARHSGSENKKYAIGTSNAVIEESSNRALSNPTDENIFSQSVADTERNVRAQAVLRGWSEDQTQLAIEQSRSNLWAKRVQGLAKQQPIQAGKMMDEAVKAGIIQGEDIAKTQNMVQQARNTVGARMISNEVTTGSSGRYGAGPVDIGQAAYAIGKLESGGNYSTIGVQTKYGRALGKYQVMEQFLPEFLQKAGMPPMTKEEYLKSPDAQDKLFSITFGRYMQETGTFNDAASKWLTGKPLAQAGNVADAHGTTAAKYVATANRYLAESMPLSKKQDLAAQIANEKAPDDPLFADYTRDRVSSDHNRIVQVKRDDEFQNRQTIEGALMGGQSGKLPTTVEELTADPQALDAWEKLNNSTQRRYMGVLAKNAKGDTNWTDTNLREYQRLKGMAQADPADFLDMDVIGTDLPMSAKREMINLQGKLKGKAEGDPRVQRALNILAPDMQAAGIDRKDKDNYYRFTGALSDQLAQFADENKRPSKIDEIKLIGSRLMQQQPSKEFWFSSSRDNMYRLPVPKAEGEKIKSDPAWNSLGIEPTEQQIQRIYTRKLYNDLYGGSVTREPTASVPVSK